MVAAVAGLHVALAYGLMQVQEVREAVAEVAPIFVSMVAPSAPPVPPIVRKPTPVAPPPKAPAPPVAKPLISAEAKPADPAPSFAATPPEPAPPLASPPPPAPVTPGAAAPIKTIPSSAVQYLEAPTLVYPRASRRAGEAGRVVLRVYVDEAGLPQQLHLSQSSGFPRLDEAAMAAVQKARFKPYSNNGQPTAGWALVPLTFDLEK